MLSCVFYFFFSEQQWIPCCVCLLCRTTVLQSMKLGIDVNRHKEIIVKAISGLLLLILKHFKLNHVYQVISTGCTPIVKSQTI